MVTQQRSQGPSRASTRLMTQEQGSLSNGGLADHGSSDSGYGKKYIWPGMGLGNVGITLYPTMNSVSPYTAFPASSTDLEITATRVMTAFGMIWFEREASWTTTRSEGPL